MPPRFLRLFEVSLDPEGGSHAVVFAAKSNSDRWRLVADREKVHGTYRLRTLKGGEVTSSHHGISSRDIVKRICSVIISAQNIDATTYHLVSDQLGVEQELMRQKLLPHISA